MAKTCESNGNAGQRGSITPFADAGRARHGLSLIEVLMAIFVVTVGLLGVVTLLPLSQKDASQGAIEDRISLVGKSAWRDFVIRGMNRPGVWFYGNGQPVYDVGDGWLNEAGTALPTTGAGLQIPPTFVLDPWLIARVLPTGGNPHAYHFGGLPDIPRAQVAMNVPVGEIIEEPSVVGLQGLADELFMFSDDLVFQPPTNPGELPRQVFSPVWTPETPAAGYKKTSAGLFSWMAILAPELNLDSGSSFEVKPVPGMYRLSLVVFHRRPFSPNHFLENEQTYVAEPVSGGWGVADVLLRSNTGKLEVKRNQWIALVSTDPNVPPVLRWFRITKTGGDPYIGGNELLLECALVGPYDDGVFMGGRATAVMVKGVVAVFEKVVSLDFN